MGELVVTRAGGHARRAIVRVILKVGNDVGKVRQTAIRQVSRELCEGNDILSLDGAIDYIGVVNERVVAARIRVNVGSEIAYSGQAFRVRFPRFSSRTHSPNQVVIAEYAGASVVGGEE